MHYFSRVQTFYPSIHLQECGPKKPFPKGFIMGESCKEVSDGFLKLLGGDLGGEGMLEQFKVLIILSSLPLICHISDPSPSWQEG